VYAKAWLMWGTLFVVSMVLTLLVGNTLARFLLQMFILNHLPS
jgi:hypothetical protein